MKSGQVFAVAALALSCAWVVPASAQYRRHPHPEQVEEHYRQVEIMNARRAHAARERERQLRIMDARRRQAARERAYQQDIMDARRGYHYPY